MGRVVSVIKSVLSVSQIKRIMQKFHIRRIRMHHNVSLKRSTSEFISLLKTYFKSALQYKYKNYLMSTTELLHGLACSLYVLFVSLDDLTDNIFNR